MRTVIAAVVVVASMIAGAPAPAPAGSRDRDTCRAPHARVRVPAQESARIRFEAESAGHRHRGVSFDATEIGELSVVVRWEDLDGMHTQRLELHAPDGSLYQRYTEPFTGGARRPVEVRSRLIVSGSSLEAARLYGEWCAEVYLDGEDAPVARRAFALRGPR